MKLTTTARGFSLIEFQDYNRKQCSLQKSSLADNDCIWLGIANNEVRVLIPGKSWQPMTLPKDSMVINRMHLTREMVAELIPILQRFVDTGEIEE
jgi:hypothetical protein